VATISRSRTLAAAGRGENFLYVFKGGLKRSVATEDYGIPLGIAAAGANRHDSPLLAPTLQAAANQLGGVLPDQRACHLDGRWAPAPCPW
jgi:hypothetical protein